jgi:C4-type Zn-finger protein
MKSHSETIRCPECGQEQKAKVLHTIPFTTYIHECIKCNYVIMESEWDEINKEFNNK